LIGIGNNSATDNHFIKKITIHIKMEKRKNKQPRVISNAFNAIVFTLKNALAYMNF